MNNVGIFKDHDYMDEKDHEIKMLELAYATDQAQIARIEKRLVNKTTDYDELWLKYRERGETIVSLRYKALHDCNRLKEIENHWLYKFYKSITNLHKLRLHIKE